MEGGDASQLLFSSTTSGLVVCLVCTPLDVIKNVSQVVGRPSTASPTTAAGSFKNDGSLGNFLSGRNHNNNSSSSNSPSSVRSLSASPPPPSPPGFSSRLHIGGLSSSAPSSSSPSSSSGYEGHSNARNSSGERGSCCSASGGGRRTQRPTSTTSSTLGVARRWWLWPRAAAFSTSFLSQPSFSTARRIYSSRGLSAFWTGLGATCAVIVPANFIFFFVYERLKARDIPPWAAGVEARAAAVVFTAPMEYARTKLQADLKTAVTARSLLQKTVVAEGLPSLWRGVAPTLIRDVPFSALYWQLNEAAKRLLESNDEQLSQRSSLVTKFFFPFVSGGLASGVAALLTHPFDVVKTNLQAEERRTTRRGFSWLHKSTSLDVVRQVYAVSGLRGFASGLFPRLVKIVPASAVMLSTYEFTRYLANSASL